MKKVFLFVLIAVFSLVGSGCSNNKFDVKKLNEFNINLECDEDKTSYDNYDSSPLIKKEGLNSNDIISDKTKLELKLKNCKKISLEGPTPFNAKGTITIAGKKFPVDLGGDLSAIKVSNGKLVLIGTLEGYVNNLKTGDYEIILSVSFLPDDNKCRISSTIGINSGDIRSFTMFFGKRFDEASEADKIFLGTKR